MRKALTLLCVISSALSLFATTVKDDDKTLPVPIIREGTKKGGILRSPEQVPLSVFLIKDMSLLNIQFQRNVGELYFDLENKSTGGYVSDIIDSQIGNVIIPFSGEEGYYTITFTLADGVTYIGEFEI